MNKLSNEKYMINRLIPGLIKKTSLNKYFPKSYQPSGGDINVKVDLSN